MDDVHLCLRVADLLEGLITTIRHRFVRIAASATNKSSVASPRLSKDSSERLRPAQPSDTNRGSDAPAYNTRNTASADRQTADYSQSSNLGAPPTSTMVPPDPNYINDNDFSNPSYENNLDAFTFPCTEDWLTLDLHPLFDAEDNAGMNEWFADFGPDIHNNLDGLGRFMDGFGDEGFGEGGGVFR